MKEIERYGKLLTLKLLQKGTKVPHKSAIWLCRCDCGNEKAVKAAYLKAGTTRSCGCLTTKKNEEYHDDIRIRIRKGIHINETGCWLWQGAKHKQGYGSIAYRSKPQLAHRISWEVFKGKIPDGMKICHKCDVTSCVNPDHLFLGTQKDNVSDAIKKGKFDDRNMGKRRIKLNWNQVQEIKKLSSQGTMRKELEKMFEVSQTCIAKILRGESWNINWTKEL